MLSGGRSTWRPARWFSVASWLAPETVFLLIGLVAGLFFVVVTPPFKGADEPAHWQRAYQVSEGGILAQRQQDRVGGLLPESLEQRWRVGPREPLVSLRPEQRTFIDFRNTAVFPPVPYLPHALAIAAARVVAPFPAVLFYASRLAGLAASLALVFFAIRITPIGKRVFLLLALTPMAIRQMGVITADSVTNGAALLLIAMLLRLALDPDVRVTDRSIVGPVLCSLAVTLSKIAYIPLVLLYFLCPIDKLGGRRRYLIAFVVVLGLNVIALAAWFWAIRDLYLPQRIAPDADPARQVAFILTHPFRYAHVLLADLYHKWPTYLSHCTGYAGTIPRGLTWVHLGVVAIVALVDGRPDVAIDRRGKAVIVLTCVLVYILVNTLNYLGWNPVGAATIEFVQGRYYIPILPLLFLLLSNRHFAGLVSDHRLSVFSACAVAVSSSIAVGALLLRWVAA